jgi:hypothetical protein
VTTLIEDPVTWYTPPGRRIDRVFLHCSASDATGPAYEGEGLVATVRDWHVGQRGWSDVGYHWLIDPTGLILPGRSLERAPAAQRGHNKGTLAIMVHGLTMFSEASLRSVQTLCRAIDRSHGGWVTFHGHCEVSPKTCPVFDYRALLGLSPDGSMPGDGPPANGVRAALDALAG